jgi:lysine 2,3-aminomutase
MVGPQEAAGRFGGVDLGAWRALAAEFPVRLSRSWLRRMVSADGPLGRQVLPRSEELQLSPEAVPDPVGEQGQMVSPWVVQKHADRALLLPTRRCHVHCRYCFRRDLPGSGEPSPTELQEAINHLKSAGLNEVILSGGDPLVLRDSELLEIIDALRPEVPRIRIHTRAPITFPQRVTPALAQALAARAPLRMIVHINHPDELSEDVRVALRMLRVAGVPLLNQSVLLAGVNDDARVLAGLNAELEDLGILPYYLHHTDRAPGTAHFWVEIDRGLAIYSELCALVAGPPEYVIDPPDGSGKIPVADWAARNPSRPLPSTGAHGRG